MIDEKEWEVWTFQQTQIFFRRRRKVCIKAETGFLFISAFFVCFVFFVPSHSSPLAYGFYILSLGFFFFLKKNNTKSHTILLVSIPLINMCDNSTNEIVDNLPRMKTSNELTVSWIIVARHCIKWPHYQRITVEDVELSVIPIIRNKICLSFMYNFWIINNNM